MKKFRGIMALAVAMVMMLSMSMAVFAATTTTNTTAADGTVTTTTSDSAKFTMTIGVGNTNTDITHTYEGYQIFSGDLVIDVDADGKVTKKTLSNIVWGTGVDTSKQVEGKTLIEALAADSNFTGVTTAAEVAKKMDGATADAPIAQTFADIVSQYLSSTHTDSTATKDGDTVTVYSIANLDPGYYLVKDKDASEASKDDFYTRFVLEVVSDVTAAPKGESPSVDKQVSDDETEDSETWYEAADHQLYESFQFKLTATIPADVDLAKYELYKAEFTDTMSTGVTFEKIDSVKVNNKDVTTGYTLSENIFADNQWVALDGDGSTAWTLTFADILTTPGLTETEKAANVTIEVIYSAHLNENAKTFNFDVTNDSTMAQNKVKLTFSNNPNAGGTGDVGETPEDTVWVFAYKVDNTKYKDSVADANKFGGAGFTLYAANGTTRVPLVYDSTKSAYRPLKNNTEVAGYTYDSTKTGASAFTAATSSTAAADIKADLVSADSTGLFNIIGLDEGTYVLKETVVPAGYNKCDDITIKIVATTTENASTTGADLVMTSTSENVVNNVVNNSGAVLPSTGGIGTTIFYIIGAVLVLGAGVVLVTRRRMSAN